MGVHGNRFYLFDDRFWLPSVVFILKNDMGKNLQRAFLGFAAGVMIAASVWSLLIPSIDQASGMGRFAFVPAAGGFALGGIFLMLLDMMMPHLHLGESKAEGVPSSFRRTTLLILAVTLHNIPEGMAVGLAFALGSAASGGCIPVCSGFCPGCGNRHPELPGRSSNFPAPPSGRHE